MAKTNTRELASTHQTSGNTTCPFLETRCYMRWQYSLRRIVLFWWPDIATVLRTKRNCHDQIVLTFKPWLSFWLRWCQNALCERWHPRLLSCDLNLHLLGRKTRRAPEGKGILDYFILLLCMLEICHQNLLHRTWCRDLEPEVGLLFGMLAMFLSFFFRWSLFLFSLSALFSLPFPLFQSFFRSSFSASSSSMGEASD